MICGHEKMGRSLCWPVGGRDCDGDFRPTEERGKEAPLRNENEEREGERERESGTEGGRGERGRRKAKALTRTEEKAGARLFTELGRSLESLVRL